jgi:SAM-dependent methyltransferase
MRDDSAVADAVRERYGRAAIAARSGAASCCDSTCCSTAITSHLYEDAETRGLPREAVAASLGCGNPTSLIDLHDGDTVLDLGSGGGIDVLLSARRVGPTGRVYGLDMTDEMLALARENQTKAGVVNVEFLKGEIERIPLPDDAVDVIISNCVINLSTRKDRVFAEAFRVLRPGGRFAVSDIVVLGADLPSEVRRDMDSWTGCVAGALRDSDYRSQLAAAGFTGISVEPWRLHDGFASAFIRATKPQRARACCGPDCCA